MLEGRRRLVLVVGARPNFVKAAAVLDALAEYPRIEATLVHTGQHYDANLSNVFFEELGIREPDVHLQVGSGTHAAQTGRIMQEFERYLMDQAKRGATVDRVVVVGDVNSTLACTIVATKMQIPVAHVEAGLRSFDRSMPEEINRIATDALCDLLLCSEPAGVENLRREGRPASEIELVGNVMIDTLFGYIEKAQNRSILEDLGLLPGGYGVVTMHRPANVDDPARLARLVDVMTEISRELPLVFAVHPRTSQRLGACRLTSRIDAGRILTLGPQGYLDFLCLTSQAKLVITDSGGLQEETTALGVPCLTLRRNTERPITVEEGTSTLVGDDAELLRDCVRDVLDGDYPVGRCPELWDGRAGRRVAAVLAGALGVAAAETPRALRAA
jgi:UDP-N-acetylglucosamine 2-epimerase (non-hydrolysing)